MTKIDALGPKTLNFSAKIFLSIPTEISRHGKFNTRRCCIKIGYNIRIILNVIFVFTGRFRPGNVISDTVPFKTLHYVLYCFWISFHTCDALRYSLASGAYYYCHLSAGSEGPGLGTAVQPISANFCRHIAGSYLIMCARWVKLLEVTLVGSTRQSHIPAGRSPVTLHSLYRSPHTDQPTMAEQREGGYRFLS